LAFRLENEAELLGEALLAFKEPVEVRAAVTVVHEFFLGITLAIFVCRHAHLSAIR
jgi:hypothetical protein